MLWVTDLLEENEAIWKREEEDRREKEIGRLEEWGKMTRTDRIAELKKHYSWTCMSPSASQRMKKRRILPAWMQPGETSPSSSPRVTQPPVVKQQVMAYSPSVQDHDSDQNNTFDNNHQPIPQLHNSPTSPSPGGRQTEGETDHHSPPYPPSMHEILNQIDQDIPKPDQDMPHSPPTPGPSSVYSPQPDKEPYSPTMPGQSMVCVYLTKVHLQL